MSDRLSLPLLTLQFRRQAQSRAMYGRRFGVAALLLVLLLLFPLFRGIMSMVAGGSTDAEAFGRYLVTITQYLLFGATLLGPLMLAPALLAREYEDRTLGLLLLANARPVDLVLGKFLVAFLEVELLLLLTLPVLALGAMFGGVVVADAVRMFAMLSLAAAMFTAVGTLCSARSRSRNTALVMTAVAFLLLFLLLYSFERLSGAFGRNFTWNPYYAAFNVWGFGAMNAVWPGVLAAAVVSPLALWAAVRSLPTDVDPASAAVAGQRRYAWVARLPWLRSPVSCVTAAYAGGLSLSGRPLYIRLGGLLGLVLISFVPGLGGLVVTIVLYVAVVQTIGRMCESGAMDDLRVTLLDNRHFGTAVYLGLLHAAWMYFVAFAVVSSVGYLFQPDMMLAGGWDALAIMVLVVMTLLTSFVSFALIVVLAASWGVYDTRRRYNGLWVYFVISFVLGFIGAIAGVMMMVFSGFNNITASGAVLWLAAPALVSAGIMGLVIFRFVRTLGRQLRYPRPTNFEDPYGRYADELGP